MRILIHTDAPHHKSAYGRQCRDLIEQFQNDGHEVAVVAKFGISGGAIKWKGVPIFSPHSGKFGVYTIKSVAEYFKADIAISIYEMWSFPKDARDSIGQDIQWLVYYPLDGSPSPERANIVLNSAEWVMAYTKFGQEQFANAGIQSDYTPPGFDLDLFKPGDKAEAKKYLGIDPDQFLVTTVGANKGWPSRKSHAEIMEAYADFRSRHEDVAMYAHTTEIPVGPDGGIFFKQMMEFLKIPEKNVTFPDFHDLRTGIPDSEMAIIYQASDVLVAPSMAEGFCFPILEAQACGVPVITLDGHVFPELTFNGYVTQSQQKFFIPRLNYYWSLASIQEIDFSLEATYEERSSDIAKAHSEMGRQQALDYSWDNVYPTYWKPFLDKVEASLW